MKHDLWVNDVDLLHYALCISLIVITGGINIAIIKMLSFPNLHECLDSWFSLLPQFSIFASILNKKILYGLWQKLHLFYETLNWQHFDAFATNIQHLEKHYWSIHIDILVSIAFILFIKEAGYRTQAKQQWTSCWIFYPHRRAKCCTSFMGYVFIHILSLFPECCSVKITLL